MILKKNVFLFIFVVMLGAMNGCATIEQRAYLPMYVDAPSESFVIPDGYKTYTLFFTTNYGYSDSLNAREMNKLNKRIKDFGKSVSKDNLIVWVGDSSKRKLNVELGKTLADRLSKKYLVNIGYSDGPYIVFMNSRPDLAPVDGAYMACVGFSEKKPKYIYEFLDYTEAGLRRNCLTESGIKGKVKMINIYSFWERNKEDIKFSMNLFVELSKVFKRG